MRKDQPGTVICDFHTAHTLDGKKSMPLSDRYYLSDAVFLAGIGGERSMLETLDRAVRYPAFPLYRRTAIVSACASGVSGIA